jgi:uncharacterized cupredoxin-like copper-binding protein
MVEEPREEKQTGSSMAEYKKMFRGKKRTLAYVGLVAVAVAAVVYLLFADRGPQLAEIRIDPEAPTLASGTQRQFTASGVGERGETVEISPEWSVTGDIGEIDDDGVFSAQRPGTGTVTASLRGVEATAAVTVIAGKAERLTIEADPHEQTVAETIVVRATLRDGTGSPVAAADIAFSLETEGASLDVSKATTDSDGEATAVLTLSATAGENRVVVSSGDLSEVIVVTGLPDAPVRLELTAAPEHTLSGGISTLTARATDEHGNPIQGVELLFAPQTSGTSLDIESARTGPDGEATAVLTTADQVGANTVDVSAEGLPRASVRVHGGRLSRMALQPAGTEVVSGASQRFEASGFDETGSEIAIEPRWSVTGDIGTVDETGNFTGVMVGRGSVVATLGNITGTAEVTVAPGSLAAISVSPQEVRVATGEEHRFECEGRDAAGNEVTCDPDWSLSEDLGAISSDGVYTAGPVGEEKVVATVEGFTGEALVRVTAGSLSTIRIDPTEVQVEAGATQRFVVTGFDSTGNEVVLEPTWTVSQGVGEIDAEGRFTAAKAGTGELVVVSENVAARAKIEVTPGELSQIVVTPDSKEVASGTSFRFAATGRDRFGNELAVSPSWSITGGIGTIDETGHFMGVKVGEGQVVATSGSVAGQARLAVVPGEVVKLEIVPKEAKIVAGSTMHFEITAFDAAGNRQEVKTEWKVVGGIGDVDPSGTFQARVAGDGKIVGSYEDVSTSADVRVDPAELATIVVSPDTLSLQSGSGQRFSATGEDSYGNELPIEPAWTVTGGIGVIEPTTGELTAVRVGQGSVVATVRSLGGRADVRVTPGPLASIEVSPVDDTVTSGRTRRFEATGRDEKGNLVSISPSWTATDNVGRIDDTGLFTATSVGAGKVVATVGNVAGTTEVTVEPGALATLDVKPEEVSLKSGETLAFSAVAKDAFGNPIDVEPVWKVEGDVGSIDSEGVFTAKVVGRGSVSATSGSVADGSRVTVTPGEVVSMVVAPETVEISAGHKQQFEARGLDAHGNEVDIEPEWSVTSGVGSINSNGLFEAAVLGEGKVVATYEDIVGTADVITVAGGLARLRILPAELTLKSGSNQQFEIAGLDANDNAIDDVTVSWTVSSEIGTIGETSGLFTAVKAGKGQVSASSGSIRGGAVVEVVPGEPSIQNSSVSVSPQTLPADGTTAALITVAVRDTFNNPVPDIEVTVSSTRAEDSVRISEKKTNDSGVVMCRVSSQVSGESVLSIVGGGVTLAESVTLEFTSE